MPLPPRSELFRSTKSTVSANRRDTARPSTMRRLVHPLARGFDGGGNELRRSPERADLLDRSLRIQSELQDHHRLQALRAGALGISRLDEADPLRTRDRPSYGKRLLRRLPQAEKRQKGDERERKSAAELHRRRFYREVMLNMESRCSRFSFCSGRLSLRRPGRFNRGPRSSTLAAISRRRAGSSSLSSRPSPASLPRVSSSPLST